MMQHRHRRRRRSNGYTYAKKMALIRIVSVSLLLLIVFIAGKKTLQFFGVGNAVRSTAAVLTIPADNAVSVSVDGGPMKRAESGIKLYAGDTVITSPRNNATLDFFDGTSVRLDESTQITVLESYEGEEESTIDIELEDGTLWIATPRLNVYSGAILRTLRTPYLHANLPSQAEVVMTGRSVAVFSADGLGLNVTVAGNDQPVIVGEGQQFALEPGGEAALDLYVYRNPLNLQQVLSPFVEESRTTYASRPTTPGTITEQPSIPTGDDIALEVTSPEPDSTIETATVEVAGHFGENVDKVRINGYLASINTATRTFAEDLALPDEDEVNITIEAIDADGVVLAEALRTVRRDRKPPEAPVITAPAENGQTYQTSNTELEITGTAPEGAVGIIVNDYRLQLFEPGDRDWSYLANVKFDNMHYGENIYEIVAINRGGYRSEAAVITIILSENAESGVVGGAEDTNTEDDGTTTSVDRPTPTTVEESQLPDNDPLNPGSISIFSPGPAPEYTTKAVENLIEGNVPPETDSVWVNGYRLRLYEPGKNFFNYIASVELNTLKRGRNPYRITIRNAEGQIIDELTYILNFQP